MKTRLWLAAAVLAATVPTIATAQGPAAPTAPRPAAGAGATGAPADGKIAVINTSVFGEKILELKSKADVVNKKYEQQFRELEAMKKQISDLETNIKAQGPTLTQDALQKMQEQYTTLLRKSEESKIAVNLERRQIGEQFKVIDGARLPERPVSPNRTQINLIGLIIGLGVGLGLVALLEYRDTTLKTDDDIVTTLSLPVLAVIPAMVTVTERLKMKRRRRILALSASVASVLLVAAAVVWRMQLIQLWVR